MYVKWSSLCEFINHVTHTQFGLEMKKYACKLQQPAVSLKLNFNLNKTAAAFVEIEVILSDDIFILFLSFIVFKFLLPELCCSRCVFLFFLTKKPKKTTYYFNNSIILSPHINSFIYSLIV